MGDENKLGPENEDTSALFVSAQKKKRAEEEAKKSVRGGNPQTRNW